MRTLIILFLSLFSLTPNSNIISDLGKEPSKEISMVFIGDIMCHSPQFIAAKKGDTYDFEPNFEYIKPLVNSADIAFANLETTLSDKGNYSGYPSFRSPHTIVKALKNTGFDVISNANNHSLDGGASGLEFTIDTIRSQGLKNVGTCKENEENMPLVIEKNDIKIGVIASTYGTNGLTLPVAKNHMVNRNNTIDIDENIKYLNEQGVDGIIYFIHWGNEYQRQFSQDQHDLAMKLFDKGINWIIGSHPHVVEGAEIINENNNYVLYSLGNVVSNQRWRYSDTGLLAKLYFKKQDGEELKLTKTEYHPFWVDKFDENGIIDYKIIPVIENEIPDTPRLSQEDKSLMSQVLSDFRELYPYNLNLEN